MAPATPVRPRQRKPCYHKRATMSGAIGSTFATAAANSTIAADSTSFKPDLTASISALRSEIDLHLQTEELASADSKYALLCRLESSDKAKGQILYARGYSEIFFVLNKGLPNDVLPLDAFH